MWKNQIEFWTRRAVCCATPKFQTTFKNFPRVKQAHLRWFLDLVFFSIQNQLPQKSSKRFEWYIIIKLRGRSRILTKRGEAQFSCNFQKFCRFFFGWLNWFSELSQRTKKTPFWPNFFAAGENLKKAKIGVFRH